MRPMEREKIAARYESGIGQGERESYIPWLDFHDNPSKGSSTRVHGRKVAREHVAFSDKERYAMLAAQRLDNVVDMREQFPLSPLEVTEAIAVDIGVKHPSNGPGHTMPIMMTTDILLTVMVNGERKIEAIAVKQVKELSNKRTLEKLEIERRYWAQKDVRWSLVTELEVPWALGENLVWIDECYDLADSKIEPELVPYVQESLLPKLQTAGQIILPNVCLSHDRLLGLENGTSLSVFRHSLARKHWFAPLSEALLKRKSFANIRQLRDAEDMSRAA